VLHQQGGLTGMTDSAAAWTATLDALEEQVRRAEALTVGQDAALSAELLTDIKTPIPPELVTRARILLFRQEQALVAMRRRKQVLTDEQRYLER
jgi:hypothetical protein